MNEVTNENPDVDKEQLAVELPKTAPENTAPRPNARLNIAVPPARPAMIRQRRRMPQYLQEPGFHMHVHEHLANFDRMMLGLQLAPIELPPFPARPQNELNAFQAHEWHQPQPQPQPQLLLQPPVQPQPQIHQQPRPIPQLFGPPIGPLINPQGPEPAAIREPVPQRQVGQIAQQNENANAYPFVQRAEGAPNVPPQREMGLNNQEGLPGVMVWQDNARQQGQLIQWLQQQQQQIGRAHV